MAVVLDTDTIPAWDRLEFLNAAFSSRKVGRQLDTSDATGPIRAASARS